MSLSFLQNIDSVFVKRLILRGFLQHELEAEDSQPNLFYEKLTPLLASGEFKWNEQVVEGLEKAGDLILAVQKGDNTAKAVIKVADP